MTKIYDLASVKSYFQDKLDNFGATPRGVDWNSTDAQEKRFSQILKVCETTKKFTILDYGCGFGSLAQYLEKSGCRFDYYGYDIVTDMIMKAREIHRNKKNYHFFFKENELPVSDYVVESGIFNIKTFPSYKKWTDYVVATLVSMNSLSRKGFSFNLLTKYSDREFMKPNLYYADPCFYFDYCKNHFSRNVALLHDYGLYDFTILVRKDLA
jgi:SAM-dependent methyltransferase